MHEQKISRYRPVSRSQPFEMEHNVVEEQDDDWLIQESETRCIDPSENIIQMSCSLPISTLSQTIGSQ